MNYLYVINISPSVPLARDITQESLIRERGIIQELEGFWLQCMSQWMRDASLIERQSGASNSADQMKILSIDSVIQPIGRL